MSLRQDLLNIFEERLYDRPDRNGHMNSNKLHPLDVQHGIPVETLLRELKQMPNGSRAELCKEMFCSMSKAEQTGTLVELSDAVNK